MEVVLMQGAGQLHLQAGWTINFVIVQFHLQSLAPIM